MLDRDGQRKSAYFVRKWFGVDGNTWIDVIKCLSLGRIWTVTGEKRLVLEIVSSSHLASSEMNGVDALTINRKDIVILKITEIVYKAALAGVARARMTLAHELGHAVLCHPGEALARITGVNRSTPISPVVRGFESEANRFAFHFLVKDELAQLCDSPQCLSKRFGVSVFSAEIWFAERREHEARPRVISKFESLLQELNDKIKSTQSTRDERQLGQHAAGHLCFCTKGYLKPSVGGKYECDSCHRIVELPDGDSFGNQTGF
ncbi:MAG TPA: ImmA/IrrE family metallo-endopeptidase [Roseiarcus sp.]|jgi:hypothetical protein